MIFDIERIDQYRRTRSQVEEAVGRINGRFGTVAHPVVHYMHRSLPKKELLSYYKRADVMFVTAYKDGMNLVAKEYVACHGDGSGALVLSEFAGSAIELQRAWLCNPHDIESVKRQLLNALTALSADPEDARARMLDLHQQVLTYDVNEWARSFLECLQ